MIKNVHACYATVFVLFCTVLAGCDNLAIGPATSRPPSERPGDFSSTIIPGAAMSATRAVALQVFKEHFRIDSESTTAWALRSQPRDTTTHADNETPRMREMLSGRSGRRRHQGVVELVQRGPDVMVRCQVRVERMETVERTAFAPQRGGDDRPSEVSANERASMMETRSRDKWVNVGRDRQLEHEMLEAIAERTMAKTAVIVPPPASAPAAK
jgi:hypothetical protein